MGTWYDNGILNVNQLLNEQGLLLTYPEFLNKFMIPVRPKEYAIVLDAIPGRVVSLLRNPGLCPIDRQISSCFDTIFIGDINILIDKCSNKYIRNTLKTNFLPCSTGFWSSKFENINWKRVWSVTSKFCIDNKIREVSCKIVHRIYPVKELLSERFHLNIENLCEFCGNANESVTHLFLIVFIQKCFGWMFQNSFLSYLKHIYKLSFLMLYFFSYRTMLTPKVPCASLYNLENITFMWKNGLKLSQALNTLWKRLNYMVIH